MAPFITLRAPQSIENRTFVDMTTRLFTFIVAIVLLPAVVCAQSKVSVYKGIPSLVWPKLYDIRFENAKDAAGEAYEKPVFSTAAKTIDKKSVSLPGYIIPFENGMKSSHFMLSSLPVNACFFCGVGGPETVIEVFTKEPVTYTEKPVEFRGTLKLNDKDPDKMIYVLENAEYLGEADY